ncbi:MAG: hypothetical protein ACRC33_29095, partial [Gemmataceae bacterium]
DDDGPSFFNCWLARGVSVQFNQDGQVRTVFLYAEGFDRFGAYRGELPAGLAFGDTPAAVRRKLGDPEETIDGEPGVVNAVWQYPSKGLAFHYTTADTRDAKARLCCVVLHRPEAKK